MNFVGIDFSINSTSVCVYTTNTQKLQFLWFPTAPDLNKVLMRKNKYNHFKEFCTDVYPIKKTPTTGIGAYESERIKLNNARELVYSVVDTIIENIPDDTTYVGLEGLSYGSQGNRLADIAGNHYLLRDAISSLLVNSQDDFFIVPPASIKKYATGKGNAGKNEMVEYFLSDKSLSGNSINESNILDIRNGIIKNFQVKENDEWKKPIDDIIDSYYIMSFVRNLNLKS